MIPRNTQKTPQSFPKKSKAHSREATAPKEVGTFKSEEQRKSVLEVSNSTNYFIDKEILQGKFTRLRGGNIRNCYHQWLKMTTDPFVLDVVKSGLRLDFFRYSVCGNITPLYSMSYAEKMIINDEIEILLKKGVIAPSDFVSPIFTRPKTDGSYRVILNLKKLNESVRYKHCKLESLNDVLNMIVPGAYMASVDIKDAYYGIPINEEYIKFLKLYWDGKYYAFQCMPNGNGPALRALQR